MRRISVALMAGIFIIGMGGVATAASGGGAIGYCSNFHVNLSTDSASGAVAHTIGNTNWSWYNYSRTTRYSSKNSPYEYYGYSTGGTLYSLNTWCS